MAEIELTRGFVALVDDEDYERIASHKWYAVKYGEGVHYALRRRGRNTGVIYMHREILNAQPGERVDHRRHAAERRIIDNRKANLRLVTHTENMRNRVRRQPGHSIFKGVECDRRNPQRLRWVAKIRVDGHRYHLGVFQAEGDAAMAYDLAAAQRFGEFACTNFPIPGSMSWQFG